jgi:hypothetical protein
MNTATDTRVRTFEHRFFLASVIAIFAVVVAGFARTYCLKFLFGTPALPWFVHLHGLLMTSWFVLFFTQVFLVASHRVAWDRRLGVIGALLALAILVVAPTVLVHAVWRELHAPHGSRFFTVIFGFDLVVLAGFAILVGSAIALRRRSDFHKRLMLLATCSIILPAIARLPIGAFASFAVFYACVLVPAIVDTFRHRRLHPVFDWGAPLLFVSLLTVYRLALTRTWQHFAERLVS